MSRRPYIRHRPIAEGLRELPGQWGEVGNYQWLAAAKAAVHGIRTGSLPAYQPAGTYESEIRLDDEGDAHVHARFIGSPDRSELAARAARAAIEALAELQLGGAA